MKELVFSTRSLKVWQANERRATYFVAGSFEGIPIKTAIPFNDGKRCIILLDPDCLKRGAFNNLFCIDESEQKIWIAELPSNNDVFTEVTINSENIKAYAWSGVVTTFDIENGRVTSRNFTK